MEAIDVVSGELNLARDERYLPLPPTMLPLVRRYSHPRFLLLTHFISPNNFLFGIAIPSKRHIQDNQALYASHKSLQYHRPL